MKTISTNIHSTIEIKNSKFITILQMVDSIDAASECLTDIKQQYPKANHYCYAYIIDNNIKRMNDDGEPGGTAGMPILNVLESNELNYIIAIVVRYFGGTKLGAGGLVRAYTKAITTSLDKISICDLIDSKIINIAYDYNNSKDIEYLLNDITIINKDFSDIINLIFEIDSKTWNNIKEEITKLCIATKFIKNSYKKSNS